MNATGTKPAKSRAKTKRATKPKPRVRPAPRRPSTGTPMPSAAYGPGSEFVVTRTISAPRERVFEAWTDQAQVRQWWGPKGFTNPICQWDARPGGVIYVVMRAPNGAEYPMNGAFREISPPERLVFTTAALDARGNPMFEVLHTVTLSSQAGKTTIVAHARLLSVRPEFAGYLGGHETGMGQSLDRLGELVSTSNREILISRVVDAPRELVWEAMTNPKHVINWWGPRGFTITIEKMDVRPGGVWKHVMHGPDGTDYPNRSVFEEVTRPARLVFSHGGAKKGGTAARFRATWTFDTEGEKTRVTVRMVFPTAEARDHVVREYGAIEGGKQTLERLDEHLSAMKHAGNARK
jgi:uncharacterized protein YndB with AHSA1/START domain